jgi:thioredoxin
MKKFLVIVCILCAGSAFLVSAAEGRNTLLEGRYALLNDSNFARETAGKLVFIDFYADWCPPCRAFAPVFAAVSEEVRGGFFVKVDIDDSPGIARQFGIRAIPYIVAVKNGKVVAEYLGRRTAPDYAAWCREQISKYANT